MMFETSSFHADCYAMRQIYQAGGFGRLIYSEGEYYHFHTHQIDSYKDWRVGSIPLWYPTHSTAYYVGVTDKAFTSVSCNGFSADIASYKPGANAYQNTFTDEIALFETAEGGTSRMAMCKGIRGKGGETGRVFGEQGMDGGHGIPRQHEKVAEHRQAAAAAWGQGGRPRRFARASDE